MSIETGYIQWFDHSSGEGIVVGDSGLSYYLHFTCIDGVSKNGFVAPLEADRGRLPRSGDRVTYTLYTNLYSSRVDRLWVEQGDEGVLS